MHTSATVLPANSLIPPTSALPATSSSLPCRAASPLNIGEWRRALQQHPDPTWVQHLTQGLQDGFRIGYTGPRRFRLSRNLSSALEQPKVISDYLHAECAMGRTLGPFTTPPLPYLQCSPLGAIPKKGSNKWRLILHLSYPHGSSINDGISPDDFRLHYTSVDCAIKHIIRLGPGCSLAKFDIKSAFRLVRVHPDDWELLGMWWKDTFFIDTVLPFGLRSAPFLFNQVATALEWILHSHGIETILHYLDDFLIIAFSTALCGTQLNLATTICQLLGVPLADEKVEGPATCLKFLGILLDTMAMEARLPPDKLARLTTMVEDWLTRSSASKSELQSLLGHLYAAAKVVVPGRTFVRRLVEHLKRAPDCGNIVLGPDAHADLRWWKSYLGGWNGKSFFLEPNYTPAADLNLFTDASGSIGYGAYFNGKWLNGRWAPKHSQKSIAWKELYAILIASATWAPSLHRKKILFHCDNQAVVATISSGSSTCHDLMSLMHGPLSPASTGSSTGTYTAAHATDVRRVAHYMQRGLGDNTTRTYTTGQRAFLDFCHHRGYCSSGSPLPASEFVLMAFAADLASRKLRPSTIAVYLASVRSLHVMAGYENPMDGCARLRQLLKGIARDDKSEKRPRLPITFDLLASMRQHLAPERYHDHAMFWSALTLGFYGFLRCGEFIPRAVRSPPPLTMSDITLHRDRIALKLCHTKTRPTQSVDITIARSGDQVCAVAALEDYLKWRGSSPGPLYRTDNNETFTREHFARSLRLICSHLGLDNAGYSGHSLRIGAATTAAARGFPDWLIKVLGRWQSDCYQLYIHTPQATLDEVPRRLARA